MIKFNYLLVLFFLGSISPIWAQSRVPKDEAIEKILSYLSENDEQELDFESLSFKLNYRFDNPININGCTDEALSELALFSAIQIMSIIDYREKNGAYVSLLELKLVEGLNKELILLSIPFLKASTVNITDKSLNFKSLSSKGRNTIRLKYQRVLEKQDPYRLDENGNQKYLGVVDKVYFNYKYQFSNKVRAGITAEKDAGEPFFKSPNQKGFDFYSGFIQIQNHGIIKSLVVGDYALQFGQGLAIWNGFGMGKSSMVTNVTKFGKGVDKYSSTDENNFFRGVATTLKIKDFDLSVFGSYKAIDASAESDTLENEIDLFTAFDNTGLHATERQFEKKDAIHQLFYGLDLSYRFKNLKVGVNLVKYQFSHALLASDKLYKKYEFNGQENTNASLHYQWNLNKIFLSGELATDRQLKLALSQNVVFNLSSKVGLAVLYRYFDKQYQALYSGAFSEGSKVQNEQGFYTGIQLSPFKNWVFKGYIDFYKFPWLKYQVSKPSNGLDFLLIAEYNLSNNFNFNMKFKAEDKLKDISSETDFIARQSWVKKKQFRIHFNYGDHDLFHFKTRLEYSWYQHVEKEKGVLAYQDLIYDWKRFPLKTSLRFLIFDTDGYHSRIYTFENDLLYNFAIPSFSDQGIRSYLLLKYDIHKSLTLWLKYGITVYSNKDRVGEIDGNKKSEIKAQLRWKF